MSLADSTLWKQLLSGEKDPYSRVKEALARQLSVEDIDDLLAIAEGGSEQEKDLTLSMFVIMGDKLNSDDLFSNPRKQKLKHILLQHVREHYPLDPSSASSYLALTVLDSETAAAFLADELKVDESWNPPILDRVFRDMLFGTKKSVARLSRFSAREGRVGERVNFYLELGGHIGPERLEQLGKDFREHRSAKGLNRLYSAYISRRVNLPIAAVIKLLGEPTQRLKGAYIYEAEGIQLYMEENQDGYLVGVKLK